MCCFVVELIRGSWAMRRRMGKRDGVFGGAVGDGGEGKGRRREVEWKWKAVSRGDWLKVHLKCPMAESSLRQLWPEA